VSRAALAFAMLLPAAARARPAEAIDAERAAAAAELRDLDRRATSLGDQLQVRQHMLRRRMRALYKLSQGGAFQLVSDARTLEELDERVTGTQRIVSRDLQELGALDDELGELAHDRARRAEELAREAATQAPSNEGATGLLRVRGALTRPVPGPIAIGFQRTRVREPHAGAPAVELPRRGVELESSLGQPVRAIAAGTVSWVGDLDGLGRAVIIDHGDHYVSVTGRLGRVVVRPGAHVRDGDPLGNAAGSTIAFELTEGKVALDPAHWLRPPILPKADTIAH
jgi:septal ring factor EnvC (AmiA/AmiB activator)